MSVPLPIVSNPSWFEIDLDQFSRNLLAIRKKIGATRLCCVVKANAYGHGLIPIAQMAMRMGVDYLAVAHVHEGMLLRKAGMELPILVMGAFQEEQIEDLIHFRLEFVISSPFKAQITAQKARERGVRCPIHIEIDTGMRRTGVRAENALSLIEMVQSFPCFELKGIYSHFVQSETPNDPTTLRQIELFLALKERVGAAGDSLIWHLASTLR